MAVPLKSLAKFHWAFIIFVRDLKKPITIFYIVWGVLGVLQAYHMELADDEAYYWVCGQFLDWGSYHTPPLIPFLSKIGYWILQNELGVRLFYFIAHILTLVIIERLTKPKDPLLFITIVSSFVVMHVSGFWAVPDIPYLLFTVLLIYLFDRYALKNSFTNGILLAIALALIIYSKYHGIVVIGSLLLANLDLFKRLSLYLVGILSVLFLLPHIIWLWDHDFITISFHLNERERQGYHWYYPLHFILNLVLITGPFIGLLLLPNSLLLKTKTRQQRGLKYILIGIIGFFFLLSFRNRIEANWLVALIIPLIILGYQIAENNDRLKKWIYYSFPLSILLAATLRIFLTFDLLPRDSHSFTKLNEFHGNKEWVANLENRADTLPIIFQQNHQIASKYFFYSKEKKVGNITPYTSLSSHFELINNEKKYLGQKVLYVRGVWTEGYDFMFTTRGLLYYHEVDSFCAFSHAKISAVIPETLRASTTVPIPIEITNYQEIDLSCSAAENTFLVYFISKENNYVVSEQTQASLLDLKRTNGKTHLPVQLPKKAGTYYMNIALATKNITPTHNSKRIPIQIVD